MEAKQTPLIDLLERVPRDAVLVVEHDQFSSSSYPVGRLCHEAAAALRARASTHADDCWSWVPAHYECAVREIERDEALLRQALEALERGAWDTLSGRNAAAAIRERLEEKA